MTQPRYHDRHGRRQYQQADRRIRTTLKARGDDCGICRQPINYELPQYHPESFEVDHIVPIARGGTKTLDNCQPTHRRCNRAKSDRLPGDPARRPPTTATRTTTTAATACPPGPCDRCNGVHNPAPAITFVTSRRWTP